MTTSHNNTPLPVMVGCGGINSAGRVSFNHAYRRMVIESLGQAKQAATYQSLARVMGLDPATTADPAQRERMLEQTLIRRIELFDADMVYWQGSAKLTQEGTQNPRFILSRRHLPKHIPEQWQVRELNDKEVIVECDGPLDVMLPDHRQSRVTSAGQLPTGFDPATLYPSRNHPRGLQMAIYGASDALRSTGFETSVLRSLVPPDQMAVYSGSAMGQLDTDGFGGMMQNGMIGKRPTSKNVALGLPEMPGDFVNAYVLGSVGETAGVVGACATFLYGVKKGMEDIRSGRKRLVIVGNAEAPVVPSVIEGYRTMGALAEDEALMALDGSDKVNNRRACRPFSSNAGFTIAESSVWLVLMDDRLAMETGARILGAVGDVHVHADGYKKSIPGPGVGNYITVGKCMATARAIMGDEGLRRGTYMQAHGTGTPQNRVTESEIFSELAGTFGIERWQVAAIKSYVGHSLAPAGGDQLAATLGAWTDGLVPGIKTIDHIADDVAVDNLHFSLTDSELSDQQMRGVLLNSKGFGGNNATGLFLSPTQTHHMLKKRWGATAHSAFQKRQGATEAKAQDYDAIADTQATLPIYQFGEGVLSGADLTLSPTAIHFPGFDHPVTLDLENPYPDMT